MEPGELTYAAFARCAPPIPEPARFDLDAPRPRPTWAELDNDGRCFWARLEAAIEHDRVAAEMAGPPPVVLVEEPDTIRVCRCCLQRIGTLHVLTCRMNRKGKL